MSGARLTRNHALLASLGLFAIALAAYGASLGNAPVWDDRPLVVDNPHLGSLPGLARLFSTDLWTASAQGEPSSFYRPFAMLTFWMQVAVGGRAAVWLRLGNVAIHALNAALLLAFARKAIGVAWRPAALVALLFVVAPVCSEPVLWISGRFDLLVVTFALAALLASRRDDATGLALTLASIAAGLMCKESFAGWLPLLVVDDLFVRGAPGRRLYAKYAGVVVIAAAYFGLRRFVGIPSLGVVTDAGVGALASSFAFLVWTFLRELCWPTTLDPFRPYVALSATRLIAVVTVLAFFVAASVDVLRRHRGEAAARFGVFGLAWFVFATVPSAVVGPTLAMIGDRYAYLPLAGLFLAAMPLVGLLEAHRATAFRLVTLGGLALALAWGVCTALHARDWRDDPALAASSLASDPENPYALYWLGSDAAQHGRFDEADALLARSMAHNPTAWRTLNAVCYVRLHQNRLIEAEQACRESLAHNAQNPRAWQNLASVHVRGQRWPDALASADHLVALKPRDAEAHYLAGVSAANLGMIPLARSHMEAGLAADPSHAKLLVLKSELERYEREHPAAP